MRLTLLLIIGLCGMSALGEPKRETKLVSLRGTKELDLNLLTGESYVIEFFASWCGSCKSNMLPISRLSRQEGLKYIPISIDDSMEKARTFFKKAPDVIKSIESEAYLDVDGAFAKSLGVRGPSVVMIDKTGAVSRVLAGHITGSELASLEAQLRELRR